MTWTGKRMNRILSPYLANIGLAGVFARYVVTRRPDGTSLAAGDGSRILGVAVTGTPEGLYEASSCWMFADDGEIIARLLHEVDEAALAPLNFPLRYADLVGRRRITTVDRLYSLPDSVTEILPGSSEAEPIDRRRLSQVIIHPELVPYIGPVEDVPDDFPYFGIVRDGVLVAVAECVVRDDESATIQQVVTVSTERGQGLGRVVVAEVAREVRRLGLVPTYLVAEDNSASMALVESLGFALESTWGFAAGRPGED